MTRAELDQLRRAWLDRAYKLQAEGSGKQYGARRLGAQARRAVQIQANTLTSCAHDLQILLDLPIDGKPHS